MHGKMLACQTGSSGRMAETHCCETRHLKVVFYHPLKGPDVWITKHDGGGVARSGLVLEALNPGIVFFLLFLKEN